MPVFEFVTNVPADKFPAGFGERAAHKIANVMGKHLPAVTVSLRHEEMFRMGSAEPCLMIFGASVDEFTDHELNRKYTKEFIDFAAAEFPDVPIQRINFLMRSLSRWQIGLQGGALLGDRMKQLAK